MKYYQEPAKQIAIRECDVVIAGGGTAGVVAAIAMILRLKRSWKAAILMIT
jgi:hypothetical protein